MKSLMRMSGQTKSSTDGSCTSQFHACAVDSVRGSERATITIAVQRTCDGAFSPAQHFELLLSDDFTLARYLRKYRRKKKMCLRRTKTNKFSNHMALRLANKDSLFIFFEVEENQQRETILIGFVMSSLAQFFYRKTDSFLVAALDQVYVP